MSSKAHQISICRGRCRMFEFGEIVFYLSDYYLRVNPRILNTAVERHSPPFDQCHALAACPMWVAIDWTPDRSPDRIALGFLDDRCRVCILTVVPSTMLRCILRACLGYQRKPARTMMVPVSSLTSQFAHLQNSSVLDAFAYLWCLLNYSSAALLKSLARSRIPTVSSKSH